MSLRIDHFSSRGVIGTTVVRLVWNAKVIAEQLEMLLNVGQQFAGVAQEFMLLLESDYH